MNRGDQTQTLNAHTIIDKRIGRYCITLRLFLEYEGYHSQEQNKLAYLKHVYVGAYYRC